MWLSIFAQDVEAGKKPVTLAVDWLHVFSNILIGPGG
jgi:hypothetical protein